MSGAVTSLERTLAVLIANSSADASAVLVAAATSPVEEIARQAARAIGKQASSARLASIIERSQDLHAAACEEFSACAHQMESALKQCLQHDQAEVRIATVEFLRRTANLNLLPQLLSLIEDKSNPLFASASQAVLSIIIALADRLSGREVPVLASIAPDALSRKRFELLGEFNKHAQNIDDVDAPRVLVESILLLSDLGGAAITNVLDKHGNACRQLVRDVLMQSSHPRLINLICQNLAQSEPHKKIEQVFLSRADLEFVTGVLEWFPTDPTTELTAYLRRIDELPWLAVAHPIWNQIPEELHPKLVGLINAIGLPAKTSKDLKKWILTNSGSAGRAAVGDLFEDLPDEEVQEVLYSALINENPDVEAWATRQLRSQKLPDTFPQLLKRLTATNDIVREAACGELADFNLEKLYGILPTMSKSLSLKCAEVLLRVNPDSIDTLRAEMRHAFRWKKLRAARATAALGLVDKMLEAFATLVDDPESSVRRAALEALAESHSQQALVVVERQLTDPNRNVRQAAEVALEQIRQHLNA